MERLQKRRKRFIMNDDEGFRQGEYRFTGTREMKGCRDLDRKILSVAETLPEMPCIDQIAIRNARIRKRYEELREEGMKSRAIEYLLGEEFFLAPESIHRVFYGKREK